MDEIMNEHIDKIAYDTGMYCDGTLGTLDSAAIERFAQQIIQFCIDEAKNTNSTCAYTTFQKGIVECTRVEIVSRLEKLLK
jgi:hypothetical protein